MKPDICGSLHKEQEGTTLLEALVGLMLMAVVGLGLSYAASRSLTSQRYLNTQNIVVSQARQWLLSKNSTDIAAICGSTGSGTGPTITIGGQTAALSVTCETKTIVIGASHGEDKSKKAEGPCLTVSINDKSIRTKTVLSTPTDSDAAKALFGGNGKIEVSL